MYKILFVCHGNICRSPMAEMVMKDLVKKAGLEDNFYIDSAACRRDEIGSSMHRGTRKKLIQMNVPFTDHKARLIKQEDYQNFDKIICMDSENWHDLHYFFGEDVENKIAKLMSFVGLQRDVADPWYTGNFDQTWDDVFEGCTALLNELQ